MRYLFSLFPQIFGLVDYEFGSALNIICWVAVAVVAYLLGSLNSAIIVSKWKWKQDIRNFGSGNAGLTNMHRVYGKDGAIYTLVGDILKQILSVLIGAVVLGRYGAYLAGGFCIIGHILPVYYGFKGGKGVLTAATMILVIDPLIFAVLFIIFALVLAITRYVSLSSIIAAITYPASIRVAYGAAHAFELFFALFVGVLVIYMHRTNLYRLFNGTESKFSFRKKKSPEESKSKEEK